jgi:pimeloyl-ACP methyl ester carboxylesterase
VNPLTEGERGWAGALVLLLATLLALLPTAAPAQTPGVTGRLAHYRNFPSAHAAPRHVTVWLPADYDPDGEPYSVLYMHDGQNLFDPATGYGGREWGIDEAVTRLMGEGAIAPTIVVGIWNTPARLREYVPAKAFDRLPTRYMDRVRGLYGGDPLSDFYLRFIVRELKPFIDRMYNSARTRERTAIIGSSMGALISLYALAEYPDVFGGAGMVSTHWPLLLPPEGEILSDADREAAAGAFEAYLRGALPRPGRHLLYFDHGSETLDRHYAAYQQRIDRLIAARGWTRDCDWISRHFPGAAHNEDSWRARVEIPLRFLLGRRRTSGQRGRRQGTKSPSGQLGPGIVDPGSSPRTRSPRQKRPLNVSTTSVLVGRSPEHAPASRFTQTACGVR